MTPGVTSPVGTSTTTSYANTGLSPSTQYAYRVAPVDNAGNIGPLSSQVSKTTSASTTSTDRTPPAQVTGLVVSTVSRYSDSIWFGAESQRLIFTTIISIEVLVDSL